MRGTGFNHQMKFLKFANAFEILSSFKVEFSIDKRKIVARKAVEKSGTTL